MTDVINLRAFYNKTGRAKYISHLDITRCMQRAIKRAELPVWYTEGFNPHIYLTFALPLSLGYESTSEVMDFRLIRPLPLGEVMDRLNAALPPDIRVTSVAEQKHKPEDISAALYQIRLRAAGMDGARLEQAFLSFWNQPAIEVTKKTKKGEKTIDLKPDCEILSAGAEGETLCLILKAAAGNTKNINPTLLTDAFQRHANFSGLDVQVLRREILLADGSRFE